MDSMKSRPNMTMSRAATVGDPSMQDAQQTDATQVMKQMTTAASTGTNTATVEKVKGAQPTENAPPPRSGDSESAPPPAQVNDAGSSDDKSADASSSSSSSQDTSQTSSSKKKKKKGLAKLNPF